MTKAMSDSPTPRQYDDLAVALVRRLRPITPRALRFKVVVGPEWVQPGIAS
jgi:hypothetical protein